MHLGITGATGFIGRRLVRLALEQGHHVTAFSRRPSGAAAASEGSVAWRPWSVSEAPDLRGLEAVVHLAGEPVLGVWTAAKKARIRESRVMGTRSVVAALESLPGRPPAFVCGSAVGYYGDCGDRVVDESGGPGTGFLSEVVQAWEAEALRAEQVGIRTVRLRTGLVLGRDGGMWPLVARVFRCGLGGRLGSGQQYMPWVLVDDVAALTLRACEDSSLHGPFNATAPAPVTNAEFTRLLASVLRRPACFPVPAAVLRRLPGGAGGMFLDSQRVVPAAALNAGFLFRSGNLRDTLERLAAA